MDIFEAERQFYPPIRMEHQLNFENLPFLQPKKRTKKKSKDKSIMSSTGELTLIDKLEN